MCKLIYELQSIIFLFHSATGILISQEIEKIGWSGTKWLRNWVYLSASQCAKKSFIFSEFLNDIQNLFFKIREWVRKWNYHSKCCGGLSSSWTIQFHCPIFWYFTENEFYWNSNEFPISSLRRRKNCPLSVSLPFIHYSSVIDHHMPFILLDFDNGAFVLKSSSLVSIFCFIHPPKNPRWQNLSEFPISSLRRWIGNEKRNFHKIVISKRLDAQKRAWNHFKEIF